MFKDQYLQLLGHKLHKFFVANFQSLVGRGSETQLQVGENLNCIM